MVTSVLALKAVCSFDGWLLTVVTNP